jgi:nicotinamidase-related amidase
MLTRIRWVLRIVAAIAGAAAVIALPSANAATIIDEWSSVEAPPPPALKAVTVDPRTTALLMLDFNRQTCNMQRRPRCVASIPKVKKLLTAARAAGAPVVFSLGGGGTTGDIAAEIAPTRDEPVVSAGIDKFRGTNLAQILESHGVKTVIVVGAAAHGAVLYTASTAAMLGMKVIIPVDGISADIPYAEQYTVWHFANAPLVGAAVTPTSLDDLKFR